MSTKEQVNPRIVGTRIHTASTSVLPDSNQIKDWCISVLEYADTILIATDSNLFQIISQTVAPLGSRVRPIHVNPWLGVTGPLNALVAEAVNLGCKSLLLQSFEVYTKPKDIQYLYSHLNSDTLVVGARLMESQKRPPGVKSLDGLICPWNTLALWDVNKLYVTGFLGVSSGLMKDIPGGIEEVATISLLQHLFPNETRAKLLSLSTIKWNHTWQDEQRILYHRQKMLSKRERAEIQIDRLKVPLGTVIVV